ncbi:hypothetical protein Tco_0959120, partial [Tanacetum coccineum]
QSKPVKEKNSKPTPSKKIPKGKVMKVRNGKRSDHLVDEEDEEVQHAPKPQVEDDEYNLQRVITRKLPDVEGKGKDDTSMNVVHDTPSPVDAETGVDTEKSNSEADTKILNVGEEQGEDVSNMVALEERTVELDEGQARSDPGKTPESRPPLKEDLAGSNPRQSHVVQAGPNPEHIYENFFTTVYPQNLDDAYTFGDQFLNDKSPKDEPGKIMWKLKLNPWSLFPFIKPLHQLLHYLLPLSISHLPSQYPELATRVSALEKICANFEKKTKLQDKTTQALSSRVYTLENHYLYSKIDKYANEVVKEAVHNALQAPLHERFRDFFEFEMKEILHDRMFESGSYRSYPEHTALYDALKLFMDHEKIEEFKEATVKSRKRCRDDQDPPPPPPIDSDQSKKKRHDSDASVSKQPPVQKSSAWKTSNIREAPSNYSKKKSTSPYEQPVDDIPIPDDVHLSESEDTSADHLPKIKT